MVEGGEVDDGVLDKVLAPFLDHCIVEVSVQAVEGARKLAVVQVVQVPQVVRECLLRVEIEQVGDCGLSLLELEEGKGGEGRGR